MTSSKKGKKSDTSNSALTSSSTIISSIDKDRPITPVESTNLSRKSKSKPSSTSSSNPQNPGSSVAASVASANIPSTQSSSHPDGCRKCGKDNDHSKLLLCEMCNDEYHIYCLDPPLDRVPEDDFYCDNCEHLRMKSFFTDDTLDMQVAALPPEYTSRFGEVVWAQGGSGYGFWPSIIYDPRLTIGSARKLALKHVGQKHLVYFFGCSDAPFTVLNDSKLIPWEEGLLDELDLGKAAKATGKSRSMMFEWALQAAISEHEKPIEYRLDWNHEEDQMVVAGNQRQTRSGSALKELIGGENPKKPDSASSSEKPAMDLSSNKRSEQMEDVKEDIFPLPKRQRAERRFYKILLVDSVNFSIKSDQVLLGFVSMENNDTTTFQHLRSIVKKELDDDSLPTRWKFLLPSLGPVSQKQEKMFSPKLDDQNLEDEVGTSLNPIEVFIYAC